MEREFLTIKHIASEVVLVTLSRPDKRNALNRGLLEELCLTIEEVEQNLENRVLILNGEGPAFCAGLDLHEAVDPSQEKESGTLIARLLSKLHSSALVTIAAVHGAAIGGGAGIMAACDLALAAKNAKMGFPEARRGLVAAQVAVFLCRQMPMRGVRELLLLGELINADQALALGLINRSVDQDELLPEAIRMAGQILRGAPQAIRETKRLLENLDPSHFSDDLEIALAFHHNARQSPEAKEGVAAFMEKRPPRWEKGNYP